MFQSQRIPGAIAILFAVSLMASPATADDFDTCGNGSGAQAIAACDRVIANPRTSVVNRAATYDNRGNLYDDQGDHDRALADYNEAIRLNPKNSIAYNNRGNAYDDKGDLAHAIADYNEAIRLNPKYDQAYENRGVAYLYSGNLAKALADVSQASKLDPKHAYHALWVDIVAPRSNVPSRVSDAILKIDMTKWPAPIIRMFLGQMTPAAVLAAAEDPEAQKKKSQVCEANFYGGELALRQGSKDEAARLFRLAATDCPYSDMERHAASQELKALGATE